ncbi:hypothetical protein CPC08DRAFT_455184 [Agrocybe pediades]|nr:hypothetical protein CPC08DRAFT_455184 [Agrocybe pediades]
MGYILKNLGTNQYFSWKPPNARVHSSGESLTTSPTATVVSLIRYAAEGSYLIFFQGSYYQSHRYQSVVYTDTSVVYGYAYGSKYNSTSDYIGIGPEIRWLFEEAGNADPVPGDPKFIPPIVKMDPLPKGLYRIRSLTGSYLLMMPANANDADGKTRPYVARQLLDNDYQMWQVTQQENGLYTISNSGNDLYLAAPINKLTTGARLLGQSVTENPKPFEWNIQSVNGVFFFVGVPTATLSMGFADYHAQESKQVALTTSINAASQIWLFEPIQPLERPTFSYPRILDPGTYIIELCDNNAFLKVTETEDLSVDFQRSEATRFKVIYVDDHSAAFRLSYIDSDSELSYLVEHADADGGRLETTESLSEATKWVLLRLETNEDVYHIIRADVHPQRAISSRRIKSRRRSGKSYFATDPLATGEVMQMFRFHGPL